MAVTGVAAILVARRGSLSVFSIPHRPYWTAEERLATTRRMIAGDAAVGASATLVFLTFVPLATLYGSGVSDGAVPPILLWGPLAGYIAGLLCWTVWRKRHRYRPKH
ncbi:hypothetical protein [Pseudonocardia sp.]|uniref:hypothetical protein n=1 Tax=Pseudonocardia sp. TaxID=60912 RepID=UPI003D132B90